MLVYRAWYSTSSFAFFHARLMLARAFAASARFRPSICNRHVVRRFHASAVKRQLNLDAHVQSYVSTSHDPCLNLSIENYLLQKSSPSSTILFLYTDRPCIIIGRNQNPWVEVNLPLLRATNDGDATAPANLGHIDLVRRRSGGGTVFHDEGNVNWSVICPSADFTRDKHAEMVVRALRSLGVDRARVNERHDIVLDQATSPSKDPVDPEDMHKTGYTSVGADAPRPLKVSGSAYKLTRLRSLHHATCLLCSPNLGVIPQYLHSPARPYIKARGVESVSSPVGNIGITQEAFSEAVQEQFRRMHGSGADVTEVGEALLEVAEIHKGYEELKSADWTYGQTPQFELKVGTASLTARHGVVEAASSASSEALVGQSLYVRPDWDLLDQLASAEAGAGAIMTKPRPRNMLETPSQM